MEKKKYIRKEEWEAIAKQLYSENGDGGEAPILDALDENELNEISKTAAQVDLYFKLNKYDAEKAYQSVKPQLEVQKQKTLIRRLDQPVFKIAAIVVFALLLTSVGFYVGSRQWGNVRSAGVVVDNYGISKIELADGSIVTLNHDTKINYPEKFAGDIREVFIEGEAFFEVKPNPEKPFVIHAGNAKIRVLGTSFNVNAYPGNAEVEVVVATGKVQVTKSKAETEQLNEVILDPGDKGVLINSSQELKKTKNSNPNFLAWKTRNLIFDKTSLREVVEQLNKVYRIQIITEDPQLDQLLLTARFEDRSIDFILQVIALTHSLEVVKGSEYYVLKKSS